MRNLLLTAASALALATGAYVPASQAQTGETVAPATETLHEQLAAFFKEYDEQGLAHSPVSKAYRGVRGTTRAMPPKSRNIIGGRRRLPRWKPSLTRAS